MTGDDAAPILLTGAVPAGASGMRDYGDRLAEGLRRAGMPAEARWAVNEVTDLRSSASATRALLSMARRVAPGHPVVWNYAPVASGYRGLVGPSVFLGVLLRLRRVPVIVVLHELAEPWRRQPLSTRVRAAAARLALLPILLGSNAWVVTTERRARGLEPAGRLLRRTVRCVPVFSNLGEEAQPRPSTSAPGLTIGVMDFAATFARPEVVIDAVRALQAEAPVRLVFIGAPGPGAPKAIRWAELADAAGLREVEFTGVLPVEEVGRRLAQADVVLLPNAQGPSSRKGTLAAALAHGRPIVSLDGPLRWDRLVDAGAVVVAPPDADALAATLRRLRDDRAARIALGVAGAEFYTAEMAVARAAATFEELIRRFAA